jgi:hypothetical protein
VNNKEICAEHGTHPASDEPLVSNPVPLRSCQDFRYNANVQSMFNLGKQKYNYHIYSIM